MKKVLAATIIFPLMAISTFIGPAKAAISGLDSIKVLTSTTKSPEVPEQGNQISQSLENEKIAYYTCFMKYGWWVCE